MPDKMPAKTAKGILFKELTWDDLEEWVGSRVLSRGQSYQRSHRVKELVPLIGKKDKRLELLEDFSDEEPWEDEDDVAEGYDEDKETPSLSLRNFLEGQTREQLIGLVQDLSGKYSSVREDLQHRQDLSKGSVNKIVAAVKKEIRELSSEPGWRHHWNSEGY